MPDEKCRLAKLEERADAQEEQVASMRNDLSYIRTTLDNQRGFVRGIADRKSTRLNSSHT